MTRTTNIERSANRACADAVRPGTQRSKLLSVLNPTHVIATALATVKPMLPSIDMTQAYQAKTHGWESFGQAVTVT